MYQQTQLYLNQLSVLLKQHQLWQDEPIAETALESKVPFCHDTMAFEQWLQFVFIEKMQNLIDTKQSLPTSLAIAPMGELMLAQKNGGQEITAQLKAFDNLLGMNND
ncbi:MAG: YqcC family protein [Pseudoalteromonas sp.]|uniref:YqcC family protein n=1 Tax=unclassified Pseudoalteromonas TaxID=194690 RepID=UPI003F9AE1AB